MHSGKSYELLRDLRILSIGISYPVSLFFQNINANICIRKHIEALT